MLCDTCSFTGHRIIPEKDFEKIKTETERCVASLISDGVTNFICGGAIGFDTLCADIVLNFRTKFPHIKLILAIPCRQQDKHFTPEQKATYLRILNLCDVKYYVSEDYFSGCMHKRNRFMVDNCETVVAYCTKNSGGTFYTVKYAALKNKKIISIQ